MRTRVLFPVTLFCAVVFSACGLSRPMAHLIINNESGMDIPLNVSITSNIKGEPGETINNTIKPGLQELDTRKFPKGAYSITAATNNSLISVKKSLSLDTDKWIMITYTHNDSMNIQKKYGYVDTSLLKKVNGKYTGLDMYIENRKPPTL